MIYFKGRHLFWRFWWGSADEKLHYGYHDGALLKVIRIIEGLWFATHVVQFKFIEIATQEGNEDGDKNSVGLGDE